MMFWTKEQYLKFAEVMMDKPLSFYAFEMLYWCGIREGELLALTPADFDFEKRTVTINKSYQRLNGQDLITTPKTERAIVSSLCRSFWQRKFRITSKCSTELEQMTECLPSPSVISIGRWIEAPKRPSPAHPNPRYSSQRGFASHQHGVLCHSHRGPGGT